MRRCQLNAVEISADFNAVELAASLPSRDEIDRLVRFMMGNPRH